MLTQDQLNELRHDLLEQKNELHKQLEDHYGQEWELAKESVSELSNYDNHPGDLGTELYEREKDLALNDLNEKQFSRIEKALNKMENNHYGLCEECGAEIPYERLKVLPTASHCMDHAEHHSVWNERPIEEEPLIPHFQVFENDEHVYYDKEDAWQDVGRYGSSESPSDFNNSPQKYEEMFFESDDNIGFTEEVEGFVIAGMDGKLIGVNENHKKHEKYLDKNDISSIIDYWDE